MTRSRLAIGGVLLLALVVVVWAIRHGGEKAGKVSAATHVERQHADSVADARADERAAAVISDSISRRVSRADDLSTSAVQATIKDLRDAIDAVPPAVAGDPLPAAPVDRLRDQINAGIARANRAADTADAVP